ncbi:RNA polymerase sigma factor [Pararcticibacter amylolyticus]|uniref:RNA polymerase subunit sigma-24 n=1 Tax=Pararcticibacter amylolyticus TaxID=2173175 RepID=A0A2U2PKB9_9SPHI|nr:sigma-70 family RNA polymerase sigma factor [Pararcticibacter amylolyticus]PWG81856.1 RNA polymerase subunit sigma-24 [Pararcticibacter amylolyticus]
MESRKDSGISDNELWSKFRDGDRVCFNILIKRYMSPMYTYGFRFVQDEAFVKDCIQDVFLSLWNCRLHINQTPSVKSYLLKSLRFRIFKEKDKWNSDNLADTDYSFEVDFSVEDKMIEEQNRNETRLRILNTLNRLPRRQKEILYLRFYENLDHARIAQVMGLNRQSVYNLLYDAVCNLRKFWFSEVLLLVSLLPKIVF